MKNPKQRLSAGSAGRLVLILCSSIFVSELLVMALLHVLPPFPWWGEALLDSCLNVIAVLPVIYIFVARPMATQLAERERADEARRKSEERFRNLAAATNDAILVGQDGRNVYANAAAARLLGAAEPELLIGLDVFAVVDPARHASARQRMQSILAGERPAPFEDCFVRLDGSLVPVEITGSLVTWEERPALQAVVRDMTERKTAEAALRESEHRFRSLFESSRDAIMTLGPPSWKFTSSNAATVAMFGARDEEHFVTLGPRELSPERQPDGRASAEKAQAMIDTAMRDGSHFFEWTHRRINGEDFPATVLLSRMDAAGGVFLQATVRDITENKRAEEALRERAMLNQLGLEVSKALSVQLTLSAVLQGCCEALVRNLDAAFARIWTLKEGVTVLELQASAGLYTHIDGPHRHVPVGQLEIGLIAAEKQPHLTNSVVGDPRVPNQEWAKREGLVAFAGYPLIAQNRVVGVMALFARHRLSEPALTALSSIANEVALGIKQQWAEAARERLVIELQGALANVKSLRGLLPICSGCKKIRDDKGYWSQVETYIGKHTDAQFTHGLCPDCIKKYFPELDEQGVDGQR